MLALATKIRQNIDVWHNKTDMEKTYEIEGRETRMRDGLDSKKGKLEK
jgi:hypothetical protein